MWMSLGLALFSIRQESPLGLWLPAGLDAIRLELLSSLGAFVVLTAVTRAFETLGRSLSTRETLRGLLWTTPFYGLVMVLSILSWVGVPFLAGFAPRWGVIASLAEVAGIERVGADYFFLIALLVLCCQAVMVSLGLSVVQSLCDPSPATRPTGQVRIWRVWPFAVLLFAIIAAEWF
jgi:NADH:ubiquinone oxidoreductase subunit 2 (subunit N)